MVDMNVFFDRAPIGDPNDPAGAKLLTVRAHDNQKDNPGGLQVLVTSEQGKRSLTWIDITIPLGGLTLAGMPADFLDPADPGDPEIMLELLDRSCQYIDQWKERRAVILPKPAPEPEQAAEAEPEPPKTKGKA